MSNIIALEVKDTQTFRNLKNTTEKKNESEKAYRLLDAFVSSKGKRLETTEYIEYIF